MTEYEAVIGLEVHVQIKTDSKLFCSCSTEFGREPNANTCPVCTGQPGALPVLNKKAVELAVTAGHALNCTINLRSAFDRKNYFYPDSPKAYQITQLYYPIVEKGHIDIELEAGSLKTIRINRAHIEEDAGKLVHKGSEGIAGSTGSLVDFNRTSVPLLEIVSEPDISSPYEARAYLDKLKQALQYAGVSDANMEEGKLRCDANVSIRPVGQVELGTKTEVKNMNSFKNVEKAIAFEIKRQKELISRGERITQETRNWDAETGTTTSMRSKEMAHDYRYFPEPDLLPLLIEQQWVDQIRDNMPELPEKRMLRYVNDCGLSEYDAKVITLTKEISDFFDEVVLLDVPAKDAANWLMGDVTAYLKSNNVSIQETGLKAEYLKELIDLIGNKTISGKIAKELILEVLKDGTRPIELVKQKGLEQISDSSELESIIEKIMTDNPRQAEEYKAGKVALKGFFVGQIMKATQGRANPAMANQILDKLR